MTYMGRAWNGSEYSLFRSLSFFISLAIGPNAKISRPQALHFGGRGKQVVERSLGVDATVLEDNDVVGAAKGLPPV